MLEARCRCVDVEAWSAGGEQRGYVTGYSRVLKVLRTGTTGISS